MGGTFRDDKRTLIQNNLLAFNESMVLDLCVRVVDIQTKVQGIITLLIRLSTKR
jgi:hypothetical protein